MKLIKTADNERLLRDIYNIELMFKRWKEEKLNVLDSSIYTISAEPEEIKKTILEIVVLLSQFPDRRSCDQRDYQNMIYCIAQDKDKNYFQWLRKMPFNRQSQHNYELDNFKIRYFDEAGISYVVNVSDIPKSFRDDVFEISLKWQNGWATESSAIEYYTTETERFNDYFSQIKTLIDSCLIEMKINKADNNKKQKI